uniref:AlNc14C289G10218 protein n=1 Tax=Albugo laibachii Nc14 TaxID=890382 RepID=F0WV73_9STRA|nr:AlNc14C289G10218 [Albugo laibachii Nc14]|eukprot:CCA25312.1 AlNc14C289G10218 [Albugo laibachii Nc14]
MLSSFCYKITHLSLRFLIKFHPIRSAHITGTGSMDSIHGAATPAEKDDRAQPKSSASLFVQ